jgi:hypothetical protein
MGTGRPLILSASRRTDLPGFHAAACAARIRGRIARLRTRELYGVVFWTKHVEPFLAGGPLHRLVRDELANPLVNLTITGLGGGPLEPGSPPTGDVLAALPALVAAFHGEAWRIRWRFDPLLRGHSSLDTFGRIAKVVAGLGIESCTFSFPAYRSLKGDLSPQFEAAGIPRWRPEAQRRFVGALAVEARARGLGLLSCAQPANLALHPYVEAAQCIPADLLERGHPDHRPLERARDFSQRTHCNCVPSDDIGDYERDRCGGGCVYCYSKAGGP